jgi:hypothetical protein
MTPLLTLIYLFAFWLIYQLADALHDSWVHKEKSYFAVSKRTDISPETRANAVRLYRIFSRQWHALDAFIKGFVIANIAYWIYGISWHLLFVSIWAAFVRWLWFDACWNWFNGLSFWYRGTVAQTDSLKISDWLFFTLKIAGAVGSSVGIVLLNI